MERLKKYLKQLIGQTSEEVVPLPPATPDEETVLERFQEKLGIRFTDHSLLLTALKHRSYLNLTNEQRIHSNERLEFLGDAVLDLVVTDFLFSTFPGRTEGQLSKAKSILVSKPVIADVAVEMELGDLVLMNQGEEKTGGRLRKSIIADAFEAVIGAIYLDQGLEPARDFINRYLLGGQELILKKGLYRNYKSILLEYAQGRGEKLPNYKVVREFGPDHAKNFIIEVWIGGEMLGKGEGKSKKTAEQEAARMAVKHLQLDEK